MEIEAPNTIIIDKDNTYKITVICSNCSYNGDINLEKGKLVVDILPTTKCPKCGCIVLKKYELTYKPNPLVNPNRQNPYNPTPIFGEPVTRKPRPNYFEYYPNDRFIPKLTSGPKA